MRVLTSAWSQRQCSGAYSRNMIIYPTLVWFFKNISLILLMFLGLPDPDSASLVGGTDPDPFIIKQK
jgi:hypothetical protein